MSLFLDAYRLHAAQATDAPMEFAEACGLMGLSTVTMKYRRLVNGLEPILFMILAGPSTRDKKSTSVDLIIDLLKQIVPERVGPTDITPEGLLLFMAKKKPNEEGDEPIQQNTLILPQREFGTMLSMMGRSFGSGLQSTLCDIYDGKPINRVRATSKPIIIEEPRMSILGGCAYRMFDLHTKAEDWGSGFFARLNLICGSPRDVKYNIQPKCDQTLKSNALSLLSNIYNSVRLAPATLGVDNRAMILYDSAVNSTFKNDTDDLDLRGHRERLLVAVLKISLLYQIDIDPHSSTVGFDAMQLAIDFGKKLWASGDIIWSMCSKDPKRRLLQKAVEIIETSGGDMPRKDLLRRMHMFADDFAKLMATLIATGTVAEYGTPVRVKLQTTLAAFSKS